MSLYYKQKFNKVQTGFKATDFVSRFCLTRPPVDVPNWLDAIAVEM
ncbi:hypothetical protein [Leptothermofonsia sp. ETS-13]